MIAVTADLYYGRPQYRDPELKAWRINIVPKDREREVFARINPDTDLELSEVETLARILETSHPGRKIYVESDGTVVSVPAEGAGDRRVSLAFVTAMAEAGASEPSDEDTEYYLTAELPRSRMYFSDFESVLRYLRLIRPENSVWLDGGTWEVLGRERHHVVPGETPTLTCASQFGKEREAPRVHVLSDVEYRQLLRTEYDRGFADGYDASYAKVIG